MLGCCALKELASDSGEIKSMRTAGAHLGRGVATAVLKTIVDVARQRGYRQLYLETGSEPAFRPAHALYQKAGLVDCSPFADSLDDPFSLFMVLPL